MPKRALITGIDGQDGYYLNRLLMEHGFETFGLNRKSVIDGRTGAELVPASLSERASVRRVIADFAPDEIYHLAAYHGSSQDSEAEDLCDSIEKSLMLHAISVGWILEAAAETGKQTRLFNASSSLVFGHPADVPQTENTPLNPICAYGLSKAAGMNVCRSYRDQRQVFASSGILYNHESARRRASYVSQKIVKTAVAIKHGQADRLVLGDLEAHVDWGYAPDYVEAMYMILQLDHADDFIIASGRSNTVGDFVNEVFQFLELETDGNVIEDPTLIKRTPKRDVLRGDSSKLRSVTGWQPKYSMPDIARALVEAELSEIAGAPA